VSDLIRQSSQVHIAEAPKARHAKAQANGLGDEDSTEAPKAHDAKAQANGLGDEYYFHAKR
jgi:hypothetical protein